MQTRCYLSVLIHEQAKKYGNRPALTFRLFGSLKWNHVSWNQFSLRVKQVSNALLNLGIKPQENIAVFSQNCIHYLYTDFGAYGVNVVSIPFYATSSEQQIQYMVNDAQVRFLFVGEQEQYDKAVADINAKTEIIQAEDRELQLRLEQLGTEQTALQTEMEACQKVVSKSIESTFKTFGG